VIESTPRLCRQLPPPFSPQAPRGNRLDESELRRRNQSETLEEELVSDESNSRADFSLSNSNSKFFPPGDYKIDTYLNDELIGTE
jgi:hypothetical protein